MRESIVPAEHIPHLGKLAIREVYTFYDFPRVFCAQNLTEQAFLALCVEDDLDDDYQLETRWLYVPISQHRLDAIKYGDIPLRLAFTHSESKECFELKLKGDEFLEISCLDPHNIPEDDLPIEGARLQLEEPNITHHLIPSASEEAAKTLREVLNLHIEIPNIKSLEIPLSLFGGLASSLQALLDSIMQNLMNKPTLQGRIPQDVLNEAELRFTGVFEGSFGARLSSVQRSDLVEPLVSNALDVLVKLVTAGDDSNHLKAILKTQNQRTANRYAIFLKEVYSSNCGVGFDWGSSNPNKGGDTYINSATARSAFELVSEMEESMTNSYDITAKLTGWVDKNRTFVAQAEDGTEYNGKVSDELFAEGVSPHIHAVYKMTIADRLEESSLHRGERSTFILQKLKKLALPDE